MMRTPLTTLVALLTLATGCSTVRNVAESLPFVYRVEVQQGNVITQDMIAQLQPGMEKNKVQFIMGTPIVQDTFHQSRWDYVFTEQSSRKKRVARRVSLYFNGDRLDHVAGNTRQAAGPIPRTPSQEVSVDVPRMESPGFFARVLSSMGIGDDKMRPVTEPTAVAAAVAPASAAAPSEAAAAAATVESSPLLPAPQPEVSAATKPAPVEAETQDRRVGSETRDSPSRADTDPSAQNTENSSYRRPDSRDPSQVGSGDAM